MSDNQDKNEPKLSRGLKIFIISGTVFIVLFSVVYYATHSGSSEYYRTEIEPDSNLADKELVVKQDTLRRDTAAADSANKEEEEQAAKVFNSIRGNVRHHAASKTEDEADENQETTDGGETSTPSEEPKTDATTSAPKSESTSAPKVEKVE